MRNKVVASLFAVVLSASMILGTGMAAFSEETDQDTNNEPGVTLSLASQDEDQTEEEEEPDQKEPESEIETEAETEEKIEYETLETTNTGETAVKAIDVSELVENTMPSIVAITTSTVQEVESFYFYGGSQEYEVQGGGSGIIIAQNDTELLIATNNHVVDDAKELTVCFSVAVEDPEDLIAPAVVKGTSAKYDLAVIAVGLGDINSEVFKQLKIATLGSSANLKVGEAAIVIGNALGEGQTVTSGIISALEREIATEAGKFTEFQTDAAVNFGCSGGAVLNAKGEVIGIVSAKAVDDYAESMGYGIPIDTAIPVLQDLINRETRDVVENHGYIGIQVVPVSEEAREMYNMPAGAFVYEVTEGSAGDQAGLKKGDIITKFDGREIDSSDTLVKTISYYEAGETVTVEIMVADNGEYTTKEVEVTLQEGTPEQKEQAQKDEEEKKQEENQDNKQDDQSGDDGTPNEDDQQSGQDPFNGNGYDDDDLFNYFFGNGGQNNNGNGRGDGYGGFGDFFFGNGF